MRRRRGGLPRRPIRLARRRIGRYPGYGRRASSSGRFLFLRKANAQLASANARLEAALEENAGLHAQLLTQAREAGKLDERQRMPREIHDTLAQGLTGIVTQLQAADRADGSERRRHLANVHTLAKTSLTEARRAVEALRPEPLAESHLPEAMAELARRFAETSDVEVRAETTGDPRPLLRGGLPRAEYQGLLRGSD